MINRKASTRTNPRAVLKGRRRTPPQHGPRQTTLSMVLLGLRSRKPNNGYGLYRLLERELSHVWSARLP